MEVAGSKEEGGGEGGGEDGSFPGDGPTGDTGVVAIEHYQSSMVDMREAT